MVLTPTSEKTRRCRSAAFTLVEVLAAVSTVAIGFVAVYAGISTSFNVVQATRDDLRATQILNEKMETIRLYTWEQIHDSAIVPRSFTNWYYEASQANVGTRYLGTVTVGSAGFTSSFSGALSLVTIDVRWVSGLRTNSRQSITLVSSNGLQPYIMD